MKKYNEKYWAKRYSQYNRINWVENQELIDVSLNILPDNSFDEILVKLRKVMNMYWISKVL